MNIDKRLEELRKLYKECEDPIRREIYVRQAKALKKSQLEDNQLKL